MSDQSHIKRPRLSGIAAFASAAGRHAGRELGDYRSLWTWSVEEPEGFWSLAWDFCGLPPRAEDGPVLADPAMPGARWFPRVRLNYAEEMFRGRDPQALAVIGVDEAGTTTYVSWGELRRQVASCADWLRSHGVGPDDAVVGYLPNSPEAVVAFLATASLGATWGLCGLDYAGEAALARLGQLRPKALVVARRAVNGGRTIDRSGDAALLQRGLETVVATAVLGSATAGTDEVAFEEVVAALDAPWAPTAVPFDHPLWVLFTSGTTGKPKGLVHGHGGIALEQRKMGLLHLDLRPGDRALWYTSPSWMMWNFVLGTLLCGAEIVCYDGSAGHPGIDRLWRTAQELNVSVLGTSPGYLAACRSGDVDLRSLRGDRLRLLGVTGSTFSADLHVWVDGALGADVTIASTSGGTDVCTAFVGQNPMVPVVPGELSAPCLGVDLQCFDESGRPVVDRVGELVIGSPMPSMPVRFWDDEDGARYRAAYFERFPGTWCHGDSITLTSRGSVVIHGRSDATLNRHGVRMGSADITGPVEQMPEIDEALVIGVEEPDGGYYMPLFVHLAAGHHLDEALADRIRATIRAATSPRHVPDEIVAAPGILHTRTGKKLEVPLRRVFQGERPDDCLDRRSVDDPALVDWYAARARVRPARA